MEEMKLVADVREAKNKGAARQIRREGKIPAVLYGEGTPQALSVDAKTWSMKFRHVSENTLIELTIGKKKHQVLVKDMQENILTDNVNHIDFYAIQAGKVLHTHVPLHIEGTPVGVREGGVMVIKLDQLEVSCLPKDLPASFNIDISDLNIGDSVHVSDISVVKGVEIKDDPEATVVVVSHAKSDISTDEDEAAQAEGIGEEASETE